MGRRKEEEIELCNHVKANGQICDSPALRDENYCFFHVSLRERTKRMRRAARRKLPLQLPVLEDVETIQLAVGDTLNALLAGQIDHKTAGLLLYGLQTAAGNAHKAHFHIFKSSRRYEHYHNQEEEQLEREIAEEIAEEQAPTETPAAAAEAEPPEQIEPPLPPKKAPEPATEAELLDVACRLAMIKAEKIAEEGLKRLDGKG